MITSATHEPLSAELAPAPAPVPDGRPHCCLYGTDSALPLRYSLSALIGPTECCRYVAVQRRSPSATAFLRTAASAPASGRAPVPVGRDRHRTARCVGPTEDGSRFSEITVATAHYPIRRLRRQRRRHQSVREMRVSVEVIAGGAWLRPPDTPLQRENSRWISSDRRGTQPSGRRPAGLGGVPGSGVVLLARSFSAINLWRTPSCPAIRHAALNTGP